MKESRRNFMVTADVLGIMAVLGVLVYFHAELPDNVRMLLELIATGLLLCLRDAHNFEFGSSRGSKEKDEVLATRPLVEAPPPCPLISRGGEDS